MILLTCSMSSGSGGLELRPVALRTSLEATGDRHRNTVITDCQRIRHAGDLTDADDIH